jgi:branched-chain amino acid transport system permease protein
MSASTLAPPEPVRSRGRKPLSYNAKWAFAYLLAAIVVFIAYQFVLPKLNSNINDFVTSWIPLSVLCECLVWVICAIGLNIVVGYAGLLDLGYVAFWAIGGYCAGWFMSNGPDLFKNLDVHFLTSVKPGTPGLHLNFIVVLLIAGIMTAFFGLLIGGPTLRLKSDYLALVTLGFGEIIPQFFRNGDHLGSLDASGNFWNLTNGTKGIGPVDKIALGPIELGPFDLVGKYVVYVCIAAFVIFVSLRLREGRLGRAWLAIREDELAASMMGVPLMRTQLAAYAVGAVAGGFGGVAFATLTSQVFPDRFDFSISITLLAMVVLGGMGNVWGVVLGAMVLAWVNAQGLKQIGTTINSAFNIDFPFPSLNYLLFGGALVLMMLFKREGFLPEARTKLLLREESRTDLESVGADMEGVIE